MGIERSVKSLHGVIVSKREEMSPPLLMCVVKGDLRTGEDEGRLMKGGAKMICYVDVSLVPDEVREQVVSTAKMQTVNIMESGRWLHPETERELEAARPPELSRR